MEVTMERSGKAARRVQRQIGAVLILGFVLTLSSCGRRDDGPMPPHSPPRPTTMQGGELMFAHYQLPARPTPPSPGMM
jgi:hypothetical protein